MNGSYIEVTKDFTDDFNQIIKSFKNDPVLVGIPEADTKRDDAENPEEAPITNASILAINEFGSPINNIPARPVMAIGIRNAQDAIAEQFKKSIQYAFKNGLSAISVYYNRAGLIASNSIKKAINSQEGIAEPSEATLARRKQEGFKGTKALIVTGQMRNAITYVVRGED